VTGPDGTAGDRRKGAEAVTAHELRDRVQQAAAALVEAGATEVYLFGSAARGTMRDDSDVDLAVAGLPPERFYRAQGQAADILGCPVSLIDLDEDGPFTRHLRQAGELQRVA
jgi:predicted nucleotidyltransferase